MEGTGELGTSNTARMWSITQSKLFFYPPDTFLKHSSIWPRKCKLYRCDHLHIATRPSQAATRDFQSTLFLVFIELEEEEEIWRREEPPRALQRRNVSLRASFQLLSLSQVTLELLKKMPDRKRTDFSPKRSHESREPYTEPGKQVQAGRWVWSF